MEVQGRLRTQNATNGRRGETRDAREKETATAEKESGTAAGPDKMKRERENSIGIASMTYVVLTLSARRL